MIYLDNNATTAVAPEVLEEMLPFLKEQYANPSGMYTFAAEVGRKVGEARERVAALLGAHPDEIVFTSCGTESDNTALRAAVWSNPDRLGVVTTRVEHPAVKNLCEHLEHVGHPVSFLPVDGAGRLDLVQVRAAMTRSVAVSSVMWANNETGTVFPVAEIGALAHEAGVVFHTDAVQVVGKIPIDLAGLPIDMLSLSGHKLHAPKGIGALYVRKGSKFSSFLIGGHQERGRRGGTENVPAIVALGKACEIAADSIERERSRVRRLRDRLESALLERIPNARVNGDVENRLPNTTNIAFEFVEGEAILLMLNEEGICASSGSACTSGSLEPSHVLRAMGVPFTAAHGSVRFSFSAYNTDADVDRVIAVLPGIIARLREMSPFWAEQTCKMPA
ncbi:MAG: cysteine desulfurase NifS [Actinobacteria bacterium]|nr:cysteine desulfurase NifS [Actinomycetota bacterium]